MLLNMEIIAVLPFCSVLVKRGPLAANDPSVGARCEGCTQFIKSGDTIALVPIGPGADAQARALCRDRLGYAAVSIPVHWACATGFE